MNKCIPVKLQWFSHRLKRIGVPLLPTCITYGIRFVFGCWLPAGVRCGKRLLLGYQGLGVVIHHDALLGDDVHIDQHVTVGGSHTRVGVPEIGDRVYIGAGAKILGPIKVGSDALVGANAVVVDDVPEGAVVVGVPARVVKMRSRAAATNGVRQ